MCLPSARERKKKEKNQLKNHPELCPTSNAAAVWPAQMSPCHRLMFCDVPWQPFVQQRQGSALGSLCSEERGLQNHRPLKDQRQREKPAPKPGHLLAGSVARPRQFSTGEGTWESSLSLNKTKDSSFKISQAPNLLAALPSLGGADLAGVELGGWVGGWVGGVL